ncbi:MAG: hypothetical protein IJX99_01025 [Clostridia bacterium]|nr:hypothetical protein [Clostridia bacterium]
MEFKIGDRVKNKSRGFGTVKGIDGGDYAIEFDEPIAGGHSCFGLCKENHGWWASGNFIELVKFTKDDLKDGDIVTLRNGDRLLFIDDEFAELTGNDTDNDLCYESDLSDDLTYDDEDTEYRKNDIMKVERPTTYGIVFERKEDKKEMTIAEIEKVLGYGIKIIKEEK